MKSQKKELNTMNAVASLLVILIHVLSLGITSLESSSWQAAVIYFPWRISAFVVPMFLYTGAVKVALYYSDKKLTFPDYLRYILRRITKIYLPYVLWVAVYYLGFWRIGYVRGNLKEFLRYIWVGDLSAPFYYIIIVMQFYLLLPLWVRMLRRVPAYVAICASVLIALLTEQLPSILAQFNLSFAYSDRIFPSYLVFWVLGLYVGTNYGKVTSILRNKRGLAVSAVTVLFCVVLTYIQYRNGSYFLTMTNIKTVGDVLSIALLQALALRLNSASEKVQSMISRIYKSSFSVYLSHCFFLTFFTVFLQGKGITGIFPLLILRFAICYTAPFILYEVKCIAVNRIKRLRAKQRI